VAHQITPTGATAFTEGAFQRLTLVQGFQFLVEVDVGQVTNVALPAPELIVAERTFVGLERRFNLLLLRVRVALSLCFNNNLFVYSTLILSFNI
jgi:hypothetical protein